MTGTLDRDMTEYFPLLFPIIPGSEEAALGGADWEGPGQTPWFLLCPAGRARHRRPGHTDWGSLRLSDAPSQLHQPSGGTHWYRPHLGQDAQLQGGWVREEENRAGSIVFGFAFHLFIPFALLDFSTVFTLQNSCSSVNRYRTNSKHLIVKTLNQHSAIPTTNTEVLQSCKGAECQFVVYVSNKKKV